MMESAEKYPFLYRLFLLIQQYDRKLGHRALGLKEYYALLEALNRGVGLADEVHFKKVCTLLWLKPHHDRERFDQLLEGGLQGFFREAGMDEERTGTGFPRTAAAGSGTQQAEKYPKSASAPQAAAEAGEAMQKGKEAALNEDSIIVSFENASPDKGEGQLKLDIEALTQDINRFHFQLKGNYFDLRFRQLQQGMRSMRRRERDEGRKRIDLEATLEKAARQGFLEDFVMRNGFRWLTDLFLLIDRGNSMAAFEPFSDELIAAADGDGNVQRVIVYFNEAPLDHLFLDKYRRETIAADRIAEAASQAVLILSDAGAATGKVEASRVELTVRFLARIRKHRVAWLNPMPRNRWEGTSAEYIALYVNMFSLDATELGNAVKFFKAKLKTKTLLDQYVQGTG